MGEWFPWKTELNQLAFLLDYLKKKCLIVSGFQLIPYEIGIAEEECRQNGRRDYY